MSDMREAFEDYLRGTLEYPDNWFVVNSAGLYPWGDVQSRWESWQAAQAKSAQTITGLQDQLNRRIKTGELVEAQSKRITELEAQEAALASQAEQVRKLEAEIVACKAACVLKNEKVSAYSKQIAALQARIEQRIKESQNQCHWWQDEDGTWNTECEELFVLNDGTPSENDMDFCCYCGKLLQETDAPIISEKKGK